MTTKVSCNSLQWTGLANMGCELSLSAEVTKVQYTLTKIKKMPDFRFSITLSLCHFQTRIQMDKSSFFFLRMSSVKVMKNGMLFCAKILCFFFHLLTTSKIRFLSFFHYFIHSFCIQFLGF